MAAWCSANQEHWPNESEALGHHGMCEGKQFGAFMATCLAMIVWMRVQAAAILAQVPDLRRRIVRRQQISGL